MDYIARLCLKEVSGGRVRRGEEKEQRKEGERKLYNHLKDFSHHAFPCPIFGNLISLFVHFFFFLNVSKRFKLASYGLQERPIA